MKKTISIVVALAMVFVMSFSVFATGEGEDLTPVKPTDPTELGVYYAELLNAEDSDIVAVAAEIVADFQEGLITVENISEVVTAFTASAVDATKVNAVLEQVVASFEDLGITLPDLDDILPPAGDEEGGEGEEGGDDELLPDDNTSGGIGDFLNTILGILGSIGDMIFGGGSDETPDDPTGDNGDDAWGDEGVDGGDDDDLISDTGDTTVLSVAAVALVAGAALVLTRKKSEDAE